MIDRHMFTDQSNKRLQEMIKMFHDEELLSPSKEPLHNRTRDTKNRPLQETRSLNPPQCCCQEKIKNNCLEKTCRVRLNLVIISLIFKNLTLCCAFVLYFVFCNFNYLLQDSLNEARLHFMCRLNSGRTLEGTSEQTIFASNKYAVFAYFRYDCQQ